MSFGVHTFINMFKQLKKRTKNQIKNKKHKLNIKVNHYKFGFITIKERLHAQYNTNNQLTVSKQVTCAFDETSLRKQSKFRATEFSCLTFRESKFVFGSEVLFLVF